MNLTNISNNIYELNNNMQTNFSLPNLNTIQEINLDDIYKQVGAGLPKQILFLFIIGLSLLLIYYYILPIWFRYFQDDYDIQHASFILGLYFIMMGIVEFYYLSTTDTTIIFFTKIGLYIVLFCCMFFGSRWLLKDKRVLNDGKY